MFGRKRTESKIDLEPLTGADADEALPARRSSSSPAALPARREAPPARSLRGNSKAKPAARPHDGMGPGYKFMIYFSFGLNVLLLLALAGLGTQLLLLKQGLPPAQPLVRKLDGVITGLQGATIKADVPLDTQLPISLRVPVDQDTTVYTTAPVPLEGLPATIVFPGGGGVLNATVNLALPAGLLLPIHLNTTIPLTDSVPVKLNVPVSIPLSETELARPFNELGEIVAPLIEMVDPQAGP